MIFPVIFSLLLINNSIYSAHISDEIIQNHPIELELDYFKDILPTTNSNDRNFTFEGIVEGRGYPTESHQVTTEDGYILTIYRIPRGRNTSNSTVLSENRRIVFFQHGFSVSANCWIISSNALAYELADKGYDVWLGNARGTIPSLKHVSLDPEKDASLYWDFSWDEIAYYDVPSMIDYVLTCTGQKKLFHIGHSQGATTFYAMTSLRPEINDKIIAHFSLSAVVFWTDNFYSIVRIASLFESQINSLYPKIGLYDPFKYCGNLIPQSLCTVVLLLVPGFNSKQFNATLFPSIAADTPAGASTKQVMHYMQLINSGTFTRFDYGKEGNFEKYGTETPPDYDLSKVTSPVYLFYGSNDLLAVEGDLLRLAELLPNFKEIIPIPDKSWTHLDFIFAKDIDRYINIPVIEILNRC